MAERAWSGLRRPSHACIACAGFLHPEPPAAEPLAGAQSDDDSESDEDSESDDDSESEEEDEDNADSG